MGGLNETENWFVSRDSGFCRAKTAMKWGAKYGQGFGIQGRTFAIPTMTGQFQQLSLEKIEDYIQRFIEYATQHPELKFYVTEIGCGLAKFDVKDIAPFFWGCDKMSNVYLPKKFWRVLEHKELKIVPSDLKGDAGPKVKVIDGDGNVVGEQG